MACVASVQTWMDDEPLTAEVGHLSDQAHDMSAASWDGFYEDDPSAVVVPDRILEAEIAHLRPGRALDLGCGTGTNAMMLARHGWSVLGIDWSARAIELAHDAATRDDLDVRYTVADMTTWDPDERFNLVVSTFSLPGGEATTRTLKTAQQALGAGGTILVVEWAPEMLDVWGHPACELLEPTSIASQLDAVMIDVAEVRTIRDLPPDGRARADGTAAIAFVRGVRGD